MANRFFVLVRLPFLNLGEVLLRNPQEGVEPQQGAQQRKCESLERVAVTDMAGLVGDYHPTLGGAVTGAEVYGPEKGKRGAHFRAFGKRATPHGGKDAFPAQTEDPDCSEGDKPERCGGNRRIHCREHNPYPASLSRACNWQGVCRIPVRQHGSAGDGSIRGHPEKTWSVFPLKRRREYGLEAGRVVERHIQSGNQGGERHAGEDERPAHPVAHLSRQQPPVCHEEKAAADKSPDYVSEHLHSACHFPEFNILSISSVSSTEMDFCDEKKLTMRLTEPSKKLSSTVLMYRRV